MPHSLTALYTTDETQLVGELAGASGLTPQQASAVMHQAGVWVEAVRAGSGRQSMIDAFLQEYGLSTEEGVILMRLSEALIRTPDFATAQELMRDKLSAGSWNVHAGASPATIVNAATLGLRVSAAWIQATAGKGGVKLAAKLGDRVLHSAVVQGMGIMARHFVLGHSIDDALGRARGFDDGQGLYSFDMLGEGALTFEDAQRYFEAYHNAIEHLAGFVAPDATVASAHGLSVKLSALHPRYDYAKRGDCVPDLVAKVRALALIAKRANIGLSIDAEEAHRLELSLEIFDQLLNDPALAGWDGLGIVIQAYQRRARGVIDHVVTSATRAGRKIAVRLVKGAYWDSEIKRAQEMGLDSYPVFTRKEHTDISYLACAAQLLAASDYVFAQFATHNAHTAAAIVEMAGSNRHFEFQRLHGMGEALHAQIAATTHCTTRVYAPVGGHKELLPYLVRRLLENGANSSFVNQLMNPEIEIDDIVANPIAIGQSHGFSANPAIPPPCHMFGDQRLSARGIDLRQSSVANAIDALNPLSDLIGDALPQTTPEALDHAVTQAAGSPWPNLAIEERAACLRRVADIMEARLFPLMSLCVGEAFKTWPDALAEVREAIDFCRYYADQACGAPMAKRAPLGTIACISPWNFPLAIFIGQVAAALVTGNRVIAKPAGQTPKIARAAVEIFIEAGVPKDALHLVIGEADLGAALVGHREIDGVCFTGSTLTAGKIARTRADIGRGDSVLIAETGGINAMIIDSTALLEQAVNDVMASAFQSAGQRCSACRLVCVQDDIGDAFEAMLLGAMSLLELGEPALRATDVGPVIDEVAHQKISHYIHQARQKFRVIGEATLPQNASRGHFIAPIAIAITKVSDVETEVFGPVLHVVRFKAAQASSLIDEINALGYGLTLGVHSRIDARVQDVAKRAHVGNVYVNRNQIGAVVGVQPFGGEGLSGTGPKAGGPHYLLRLSRQSTSASHSCETGASLERAHAPNSRPNSSLTAKLLAAQKAQQVWSRDSEGAQRLENIAIVLGDEGFVSSGYSACFAAARTPVQLPGPTGEENTLTLVPRGLVLCLGGGDEATLVRQVLMVLASGNLALVPEAIAPASMVKAAQGLVVTIPDADIRETLHGNIQAVIVEGQAREDIARELAMRTGPIIPLLSIHDDFYRFFHERTLTIDTTAAGGNASLLAMQSEITATAVH
jgi:RHH-type transcriptional regulator, proline utilization regulon repressor / proline dehydrogenase / delta 1-pyrroline-5-carboxylate dehydrogenase